MCVQYPQGARMDQNPWQIRRDSNPRRGPRFRGYEGYEPMHAPHHRELLLLVVGRLPQSATKEKRYKRNDELGGAEISRCRQGGGVFFPF